MTFRPLLTAAVLASAVAVAAPHAQTLSKADVEKIVKDYIASHGSELMTSIETAQKQEQLARFAKLIDAQTPVRGPASAPVTIVEFSDFECPFCDKVQGTLAQVRAKYGDNIRWAFKNLPLDFHKSARPAAYAALAAHQQGKFWDFSKELWANQDKLGDAFYVATATKLKLDVAKFNTDRASARIKAQVDRDLEQAQGVEARGTPYFMINGKGISGALPVEAFSQIIDAELAARKKK